MLLYGKVYFSTLQNVFFYWVSHIWVAFVAKEQNFYSHLDIFSTLFNAIVYFLAIVLFVSDWMKNSHLDIFAVLFPCYRVLLQLVFFQVTFFSVKFASLVFFVKLWHSKISFRRVCPC